MTKVYLVGAGPGDPQLLTQRAQHLIATAQVVLYDRLVGPQIIHQIPSTARKIYVGKQPGAHRASQAEIQALLVELAGQYQRVVRLKGGDPFLFGRGGEEALALQAAQIPFEVVPGITSALAVPALFNIPATHRQLSDAVHIVAGHTQQSSRPDPDFQALARSPGTLVFLMGMANLSYNVSKLLIHGMDADTPCAIISQGFSPLQRIVTAPLSEIVALAQNTQIPAPSIFVCGAVVALHQQFQQPDLPLSGQRILLGRHSGLNLQYEQYLRAQGATTFTLPLVRVHANLDFIAPVQFFDWLIFTSPTAVRMWLAYLRKHRLDIRHFAGSKIVSLGAATSAVLAQAGLMVDFEPEEPTTASLVQLLPQIIKPQQKILLPRSAQATPELSAILPQIGAVLEEWQLYDMLPNTAVAEDLQLWLQHSALDWIVLTSGSMARALQTLQGKQPLTARLVCIGKATAQVATSLGFTVAAVAAQPTIEALTQAMIEAKNA